jgi:hypothetical protein
MEIINSIFIEAFKNNSWNLEDKVILMHRYAEFLIESKQLPRAISILSHTLSENMGYFNKCRNYSMREKLRQEFDRQMYFDS